MGVEVNFIAVLIAAVVSMVVGFVYYSPFVLGNQWVKLMGLKMEDMRPQGPKMAKIYGTSFILALVTAYVLFHVFTLSLNFFQYDRLPTGLMTAFWMWLGFVMPVQTTDVLFGNKPLSLFAINTGYQLLSLLAMGAVIGLM